MPSVLANLKLSPQQEIVVLYRHKILEKYPPEGAIYQKREDHVFLLFSLCANLDKVKLRDNSCLKYENWKADPKFLGGR